MAYTPTEWESADVVTAVRMNALENAVGDIDMSYTPNVWSDGDILTADKMNALEQAVASGGGGGSSDFSTAEVTIISTLPSSFTSEFLVPMIDDDGTSFSAPSVIFDGGSTVTANIILYNGLAVGVFDQHTAISSITGNIEAEIGDSLAQISGNGTITVEYI